MNKFFTLTIVFFIVQKTCAQSRPNDFIIVEPSSIVYNKKLPFRNIEIIDSRFDTGKIGYQLKGYTYEKLLITPNLASVIQKKLNEGLKNNFDSSINTTLLIVVKNLWIQGPVIENDGSPKDQCLSKLELYMKEDETFYPIKRIDSIYTDKHSAIHFGETLVMMPFQNSLKKIEAINSKKIQSLRKLNWNDVKEFNEREFQKPILKTMGLKKGIYLSFNDFLKNRIDEKPFEVKFGKLSDQLYLIDNKEKKLFTEFWGFCDGSKLYVNAQLNFYELIRNGNGFEFWGNEQVVKQNYNPRFQPASRSMPSIAAGLLTYGIEKLKFSEPMNKRPFQINMETGEAY